MPNGVTHASVAGSVVAAFLAGALTGYVFGIPLLITALLAFLLGELMLSPDLDHDSGSDSYRRWGWPLRYLWWPYQQCVPHRGVLSHCPVVGTAARLGYLATLLAVAWFVAVEAGWVTWEWLWAWGEDHRSFLVAAIVGVEVSTDVHLFLDKVVREG